ncbi:MAG: hypothetical protein ACRDQW_15895, partial [Haloechinothrix sp.]
MTTEYEQPAGNDTVAGLAQEIRLLVDMVVEHSAPWLEGIIAAGHGGTEHRGAAEDGADDARPPGAGCGWCPLCAVVAVVRGERPEFSARALEQAAQLVALLRAVLADRWYPEGGVHMPGFRPEAKPPAAPGDGSADVPLWWSEPPARERTMPLPKTGRAHGRVQRIPVRK